jgi:hypothetical protein
LIALQFDRRQFDLLTIWSPTIRSAEKIPQFKKKCALKLLKNLKFISNPIY